MTEISRKEFHARVRGVSPIDRHLHRERMAPGGTSWLRRSFERGTRDRPQTPILSSDK
jgi:hypothetical protein